MRRSSNKFMNRRSILGVIAFVLALFYFGMLDHLFETSFEQFEWPGYGPVRSLVSAELMGRPSDVVYVQPLEMFSNIKEPECEKTNDTSDKLLYVVVKSAVANKMARDVIHGTWGRRQHIGGFLVRTVFMVAKMGDISIEGDYDVIEGDFQDTYRNNTRKFIHSLMWARGNTRIGCSAAHFTLLVDDDYMVNVPQLVNHLKTLSPDEDLYEGWRFDTTPFRFTLHKHSVPLSEYAFDAYPPYISAGAVLLSQKTVKSMVLAVQHVTIYKFDDIYAGILAYFLGIHPRHNERFIFWERSITDDEWPSIIAAHGFSPKKLTDTWMRVAAFRGYSDSY